MSRMKNHAELPDHAKKIFLGGVIEKIFACKSDPTEKADVQAAAEEGSSGKSVEDIKKDWIRVAIVIDRIAFVIYVIIFICMGFFHFI